LPQEPLLGRGRRLHRLHQPRLGARCGVAVDDVLLGGAVDDRDGVLERRLGPLRIAGGEGDADLLDGGAHRGADGAVARPALLALTHALLSGLGVRHGSPALWSDGPAAPEAAPAGLEWS